MHIPPLSASVTRVVDILTEEGPALTPQNHPVSIVNPRVHAWCYISMGLDKFIMMCIHFYNNIKHFHCLKNPLCSISYNYPITVTEFFNILLSSKVHSPNWNSIVKNWNSLKCTKKPGIWPWRNGSVGWRAVLYTKVVV